MSTSRRHFDDRRAFLRALGVLVPGISERDFGAGVPAPSSAITAEEVFTLFVSEALHRLQATTALDTERGSVARTLIEAHGTALALVLSQLQQRKDDGT